MKRFFGFLLLIFVLLYSSVIAESGNNPFAGIEIYEDGRYRVGLDIDAGLYLLLGDGYFSVASDADGTDVLFTDSFYMNSIIEVRDGEHVELKNCMMIKADDFYSNNYRVMEGDSGGMLRVGYDIRPGTYTLITSSDNNGYYCIYPDARHSNYIKSDTFDNSSNVSVQYGQYLLMKECRIK